MINIRKKLQILALVAGISLGGIAQVKADLNWKHYLGAAGAAGLAMAAYYKHYNSEKSRLIREREKLFLDSEVLRNQVIEIQEVLEQKRLRLMDIDQRLLELGS